MGVSKLSANVFLKVNYSFNNNRVSNPHIKMISEGSLNSNDAENSALHQY